MGIKNRLKQILFLNIIFLSLLFCPDVHGFPQRDDNEEDAISGPAPEDDLTVEEQAELKAILKEIIAERLQEERKSGRRNATATDVVLEILEHAKGNSKPTETESQPETVTEAKQPESGGGEKKSTLPTTTEFDLLSEILEYANKDKNSSTGSANSTKNQTNSSNSNNKARPSVNGSVSSSSSATATVTRRPRPPYSGSSFTRRPGFATRVTNFLREQFLKGNIPTSVDEFVDIGERITKFGEDTYDAIVYVECDVLDLPTC